MTVKKTLYGLYVHFFWAVVWPTAARGSETEQHSLHTRPCKVEVSYPYSELCKYELLDQNVCCTHTLTHTLRWPMRTHTIVSLRPSPPASLAAKSSSHNQSPVCMKPYPHRRGGQCLLSLNLGVCPQSELVACLFLCYNLCTVVSWLGDEDAMMGEMQGQRHFDVQVTKSNKVSCIYYETWRMEDVIPRKVPQGN